MIRRYRKPYRIKNKRSFSRLFLKVLKSRFFWLFFLILFSVGAVSYTVFFNSFFQIKEIRVSGNQKIQTEDIKNFLDQKISQRFLFFPTKSIFLINSNKVNNDFRENFPQAKEVKIKIKLPDILIAQVKERIEIGIWCQNLKFLDDEESLIIQDEKCFLIDGAGVIFEVLDLGKEKESYNLKIKSQEEKNREFGEQVVENKQMTSILKIQESLKNDLKIDTQEFILQGPDRINTKTREGWEIYFNLKEDLDWQLTKLKAALEKEVPKEKRGDLEYIDLRFGNFAPLKYKD